MTEPAEKQVPPVSVLICTRNRPEKLGRTIASILSGAFTDFELIIVDQSTDDRTQRVIAAFPDPRLRLVIMNATGLARARNLAIRASRAEIVAFTDDDCICDAGWLAAIMAEYAAEPRIGSVFGRVLPYGGAQASLYCPATIASTGRRIVDRPIVPQLVLGSGNNMSFKKAVFREIGLFVESLGAGTKMKSGEDTEFVYRALRHRIRFLYSPEPLVYHDNWMTRGEFAELMRGSVLGGGAVFTKFALALDREAAIHLMRIAYYLLGDKIGVGSVKAGIASFARGVAMGIKYTIERPPPYREAMY